MQNIENDFASEEIIERVSESLDKIENAKSKIEKEHFLLDLLHYLVTSSQEIADRGDFYEAGGRLFSAGYYLEEFYSKEAQDLYRHAIEYYEKYLTQKIKMGAMSEAANVALKVANIYHDKLNEANDEKNYVEKAIELVKNQIIIIEGVGTPREISSKYQMLSMLYARIQRWPDVMESAKKALELAKSIKEYSIIANAYNDIALTLEHSEDPIKGQNVLFEAMDYFAKEAALHEESQELLPLSQLYQIIKNLYSNLRDSRRFEIYSRKEAAVYISMAKIGVINNSSNAQIASFYRGAALCYRETNQNHLDCATCFFLAGNYYNDAKKNVEAAINYQDAANVFEHLQKYKKAYELYMKAAEDAIKANNLETAIENLMQSYEMVEKEDIDPRKVINLLVKHLIQLAKIQEAAKNNFVAATLYLEAVLFLEKLPLQDIGDKIQYLNLVQQNYFIAAKSADELGRKSSIAYSYVLSGIVGKFLQKEEEVNAILKELTKINSNTAQSYLSLLKKIFDSLDQHTPLNFGDNKKMAKLYESSDEIRKIMVLFTEKTANNNHQTTI